MEVERSTTILGGNWVLFLLKQDFDLEFLTSHWSSGTYSLKGLRKTYWWKGQYLPKGRRLTLINSTSANVGTYFMSFLIPVSVAKRLGRTQKDFLWKGNEDE